jgi:hypothetical protein
LGFVAIPADLAMGGDRRAALFRQFIVALGEYTELIVATHAAAVPAVTKWLPQDGHVGIIAIDDAADFTSWVQDACLVVPDNTGKPSLILPTAERRQADKAVAELVAREIGFDLRSASSDFEGGNVLVGSDFALAGRDLGGVDLVATMADAGMKQTVHIVSIHAELPRPSIGWVVTPDGPVVEWQSAM